MSATMEELEALLQSLQTLKPPGVTKTKIEAVTKLCVDNVKNDSMIVQKIFQQLKKSPATHKLGVLYVVDSVTRQWMEKARLSGQNVSPSAAEGTFAAGVHKMTDLLPNMMNELIKSAPENQREKISKLLDIWERGQTFPPAKLSQIKQQLHNVQQNNSSFTPPGSPPAGLATAYGNGAPAPSIAAPLTQPPPPNTFTLLAALANSGNQPVPSNTPGNQAPVAQPTYSYPQQVAPPPPAFAPPPPVAPNPQTAAPAPPPNGNNEIMAQVLQAMASGSIPADQAMQLLSLMAQSQSMGAAPAVPPPPPVQPVSNGNQPMQQNGPQPDRQEQNGSRYRDRSRSPDFDRRRSSPNRRSPRNRRDSPTYGVYDPNAGPEGNTSNRQDRDRARGRGRNRGRNDYRQRTPPRERRQPSPSAGAPRSMQPKFLEWDHSLPRDNIRVLSRTLFVGGASAPEGELRNIFNRFGKVQTCIVNQDKRHAFVKMVNRQDAVAAKEGMDKSQDPDIQAKARQTRWGVGFGPRDCSDYATGISVIPISRLTEADRKWVVSAEYGGTGGRPLEGGMVLEEPDIEIGAGVSSKAISRRVPADGSHGSHNHGGRRGGHGGHGGNFSHRGGPDHGPRSRRQDRAQEPRHISPRAEPSVGVPPAVPGFGFQLPGF